MKAPVMKRCASVPVRLANRTFAFPLKSVPGLAFPCSKNGAGRGDDFVRLVVGVDTAGQRGVDVLTCVANMFQTRARAGDETVVLLRSLDQVRVLERIDARARTDFSGTSRRPVSADRRTRACPKRR